MIKINSDDLDNYECIGSGRFGKVYKIDDNTAYKIYYDKVIDGYSGKEIENPTLVLTSIHYRLLLNKSKKLEHSGGIKDLIYVDGSFKGVSIPYYEGPKLAEITDKPLKIKIDISKQLVRNSKELTDNHIYCADYRIINIICSNDKPQIIDLDDTRTHAFIMPCHLLEAFCVNSMGEIIQFFLGMTKHHGIPFSVRNDVKREKAFNCISYNRILRYISSLEKEKNIIFINDETNLDILKELIANNPFEIVYIINGEKRKKDYKGIVNNLKVNNIKLYDFVSQNKMDEYSKIEMVNESYLLDQKELKKVPQKN